jgi:hypothetical protein
MTALKLFSNAFRFLAAAEPQDELGTIAGRNLAALREAVARQNYKTMHARLMGATGKDSDVLRKIVGAQ